MMQVKTFEDDIRAIFERMKIIDPVDGVEFIPPKFITPALHDLGLNPTNNEIHEMLAVIDPKQEGRITYDAFCSFARQMSDTHLDEALLNKCFALFDTNHDGVLSTQEFSLALQHNGEGLSNEELELALQIADSDRNGSITYAEFVAYMIQRDHLSSDLRERIMSFRAQQSVNTNAESLRHGSMRNASIRASSPMKIEEAPVEPLSRTKSSNQETVVETEGEEEDVSALLKQIEDEELSTRHEMIHDSTKKFEKAMQDAGFQIGADGKFVCTKAMTTHSNKNNTKPVAKKDSKKCCVIS